MSFFFLQDGCTPFLLVCSREFPAECVIRCLFEAKADINAKDDVCAVVGSRSFSGYCKCLERQKRASFASCNL